MTTRHRTKKVPKKGLTTETMAVLIMFCMTFLILMIVYGTKFFPTIKDASGHQLCKQSVLAHAQKPLEVFRGSITCPIEHIQIKGSLRDNANQARAKETLARALYHCFDDFGAGKVDLFTRSGVYCNVCSFIDFEDKTGKITGLTAFLGERTVPLQDISYLDFLAGYQTPHFRDYMNNPALFNAQEAGAAVEIEDTTQRWATILVYARGEDGINRLKDLLSPSEGASGGREIGVGSAGVLGTTTGIATGIMLLGLNPAGWIVGGLSGIAAGGLTMYSFSTFTDKPQWLTFTRLVPYNEASFAKLGCQRLEVKSK